MKSWLLRVMLVPCLGTLLGVLATPARAADDAAGVFKQIPAEVPFSAVFVNLEKFDKSLIAFVKRIDPDDTDAGMLADLKAQVPVAEWIDFSKPVGMAQTSIGDEPVLWARIADFDKKIKEVKEATEDGGIWHVEKGLDSEYFLKQSGEYVVIAGSKAHIESATKAGKNVADVIGNRMQTFDGKEVVVHVNFEPMRALVLGQLAQGAQMAPMLAMMAAPQMGVSDPAALGGVFTALFDGVKTFMEQIDYLEFAGSLDDKNADITLATGYKEGSIRNYLNAQKPAAIMAFDQIEDQPFMMAASYHFPGGGASFVDYLLGKMQSALPAPAGDAAAGANDDAAKAIKLARELYGKIDGQNMVMNMSADGMRVSGDYIGKDAPGILNLQKDVLTKPNALNAMFNNGVKYEESSPKKVESTELQTFSLKFDASNPAAAASAKMMPKDAVQAYGIVGDRVRFAMGTDKDLEKAFASKITKPLSSSPRVSEALASLPAKRNAVLLLDLAGFAPIIASMSGGNMPEATNTTPGAPVAISVSLSGEPARVDIRVPLKAIERMVQQFSPKQPT